MNLIAEPTEKIQGNVVCPPDKSITQRVLLLGALQNKDLLITNPLLGADPISTAKAIQALGAKLEISNSIVFKNNPHLCLGWAEETRAVSQMENSRRSCCVD